MQPKISLPRIFSALAVLGLIVLSFPLAALAADTTPRLEILKVAAGESVTVRAHNLPADQLFVVLMAADGNQGINGIRVTVTNSGTGGTFDETYKIPGDLKTTAQLAIRLQTEKGEHAVYASFSNTTANTPTPTVKAAGATSAPTSVPTFISSVVNGKPKLVVLGVVKNQTVNLRAENFPAKQDFVIRIGPYETFFTTYATVGRINSAQGGAFLLDLTLPAAAKDAELVTVRFDGGGYAVYTAFNNGTSGLGLTRVPSPTPTATKTPLPSPTAVPTLTIAANACQIVSTQLVGTTAAGADFDAVWEVRNTSGRDWDDKRVDYLFVSGASMHKKTIYDLPATLASGKSAKIIVDMRAPTSSGTYSEIWALKEGTTTLCSMRVNVTVK